MDKEEKKKLSNATAIEEMIETEGWQLFCAELEKIEKDCIADLTIVEPDAMKEIIRLQTIIELVRKIREFPDNAIEFLNEYRRQKIKRG